MVVRIGRVYSGNACAVGVGEREGRNFFGHPVGTTCCTATWCPSSPSELSKSVLDYPD